MVAWYGRVKRDVLRSCLSLGLERERGGRAEGVDPLYIREDFESIVRYRLVSQHDIEVWQYNGSVKIDRIPFLHRL